MSDDFPTFERPAKAISGNSPAGYWTKRTALVTNSAEITFTRNIASLKCHCTSIIDVVPALRNRYPLTSLHVVEIECDFSGKIKVRASHADEHR